MYLLAVSRSLRRMRVNRSSECAGEEMKDQEIDRVKLDKSYYIAGDDVKGHISVDPNCQSKYLAITFHGEGVARYFHAKVRAQKLCEIRLPPVTISECATKDGSRLLIPFSFQLDDKLTSSFDGDMKGHVHYYIEWGLIDNESEHPVMNQKEVRVLANVDFQDFFKHELIADNRDQEEYDEMMLELYSPINAYLPSEKIQFRCIVRNLNPKKIIKKLAVLLLQNTIFFKSSAEHEEKGRMRSFLMSFKETTTKVKMGETYEWTDELQIPDPVAPNARGFHKVQYELVLVALVKGKKSDIRTVFEEARLHFDIGRNRDDYFRDFIPHAACHMAIASHDADARSPALCGESPILPICTQKGKK